MPHHGSVPMSWRLAKHRYTLTGNQCVHCKHLHFPPRVVCTSCDHNSMEPFKFSGKGEIVSYTIIHTSPDGYEKYSPYAIALVKLDEGPVISTHIVGDHSKIEIGKHVRMVFRKLYEDGSAGIINYGFKFELFE